MKKMTLAQKKRRLKAIKADLAKSAKKTHSFGKNILDALTKPPFSKPSYPVMTPNHYIRPHVPADALPGEWVKLPPMKWPETLPVKVPNDSWWDHMCDNGTHREPCETAFAIWSFILHGPGKKSAQSAWSETLVRLGYTADWTAADEEAWEAKR